MKYTLFLSILLIAVVGCQQAPGPVAYSKLTGDYWQIWTMQPDGQNDKQITFSPRDKRYPVWDSNSDGLYVRSNNNRIFHVDPHNGEEKQMFAELGILDSINPSPDSSKLLLVRFDSQLRDCSQLRLIDTHNGEQKLLTRNNGLNVQPSWAPDSNRFAYIAAEEFGTDEVVLCTLKPFSKIQLTDNDSAELLPAFSPTGDKIAYVSQSSGDYEILLMHLSDSSIIQLTDSVGLDSRPCFSPDGTKIMFTSNRSGSQQLWLMNVDGSNQKQITNQSPCTDPAWRRE